jgi:hypothetical protein
MNTIQIVHIEQDGADGILVTFSDGTIAGYVAEELIELRPVRERRKSEKVSGNDEDRCYNLPRIYEPSSGS